MRRSFLALFALAALFLLSPLTAGARPRFGLEAGVNLASLDYDDNFPLVPVWDPGWRPLFAIGGTVSFPFNERVALTTGVRYVQKGNRVEFDSGPGLPFREEGEFTVLQHYLTVPLWLELRPFHGPLSVSIGPEVGRLLFAMANIESAITSDGTFMRFDEVNDITDELKRADVALVVGLGLEFPLAATTGTANVRYSHGIVGVADEEDWYSDWSTRGIEAMLGVRW